MSKIAITDDLEPLTVSGAQNKLILDPEGDIPHVYLFSCVGAAYPMPVAHGRHYILATVKAETVPESLREFIESREDEICAVARAYRGTKWDGHNHRGQWDFDAENLVADHDTLAQAYDDGTIATYWDAGDYFSPVRDEFRDDLATGDLDAIVEREIAQGLDSGAHLNEDDVREYLKGLLQEIPQVPGRGSWIVPPVCQGQIVEVSYLVPLDGESDGCVYGYRMTFDRSDRTVHYDRIEVYEDETWDPINGEPDVAGEWELCRA